MGLPPNRPLVALLALLLALAGALPAAADAAVEVRTLAGPLDGAVGGVAVDALGFVYVADFGEKVWKISPTGEVEVLADVFYSASGNTVDSQGRLLQSSFGSGTLARVERDGTVEVIARDLAGPVGVAEDADGRIYVCACRGNLVYRLDDDPRTPPEVLAEGDLFNCPNGITRAADGTLYVANFQDGRVIRLTPQGEGGVVASLHATVPGGGNGHLAAVGEELYVTSFRGNRLWTIDAQGEVTPFAGTGAFGQVDGAAPEAQFATPNGIAYDPRADVLYVNDFLLTWPERWTSRTPPRSTVRQIVFPTFDEVVQGGFAEGGTEGGKAALTEYVATRTGRPWQPMINRYGYVLLQSGQVAEAVAVFEVNAELFPTAWNVWDSLAEGLLAAGERQRAVELYEKSLELNPDNSNARSQLEMLRAEDGRGD